MIIKVVNDKSWLIKEVNQVWYQIQPCGGIFNPILKSVSTLGLVANYMIGFLLSGAKTHSKYILYLNRKVARTSFLEISFTSIPLPLYAT